MKYSYDVILQELNIVIWTQITCVTEVTFVCRLLASLLKKVAKKFL